MVEDLMHRLRAQLAEDERIARAATPGPWRQHDTHLGQYGHTATVLSGERNDTDLRAWLPSMSQESWDETRNVWADAVHIAEHDPARVLREIDAKRRILDEVLPTMQADELRIAGEWGVGSDPVREASDDLLSLLALPYADRPGYREEWRP